MTDLKPRIAIPVPTSSEPDYNDRCWPQYAAAVEQSGGSPIKIELDWSPAQIAKAVSSCQGVLLPGSPADVFPQKYGREQDPRTAPRDVPREAVDELLLQDAFNLHKPLLGICYGMQSMAVWKGGTLTQHLETSVDHAPGATVAAAHLIRLAGSSQILADLGVFMGGVAEKTAQVNSSHHQAVESVGDGLSVAAICSADGVIEAIEGTAPDFVVGVQWHPERTFHAAVPGSELSDALFTRFIEAARRWAAPAVTSLVGQEAGS